MMKGEAVDGADGIAQVDKFATTAQARQGDEDRADGDVDWNGFGVEACLIDSRLRGGLGGWGGGGGGV